MGFTRACIEKKLLWEADNGVRCVKMHSDDAKEDRCFNLCHRRKAQVCAGISKSHIMQ